MAALDWSQCEAAERNPEKLGGVWVLRGTRMLVASIFENLEDGMTIEEVMWNSSRHARTNQECAGIRLDLTPHSGAQPVLHRPPVARRRL